MDRTALAHFTRTAAALVAANDECAEDFAAWESEVGGK